MSPGESSWQCSALCRTVRVGGLTKTELLQQLRSNAISLNAYAEQLFASDRFTVSAAPYALQTVELSVGDLGFPENGITSEVYKQARERGLELCPLELGPFLRLAYRDQPEGARGKPEWKQQAPYGSLTVASEPISDDDAFPKGFYLRCIEGVLWLRGYCCGPEDVWNSWDRLVFVKEA